MAITWDDLTVNFQHLDRNTLVEDWLWRIGENAKLILISSVGDGFFEEESGEIYWLLTGSAEYEKVADNAEEFQGKLKDDEIVREWFLINIVSELKENSISLEDGKLYGFRKLPVMGGLYEADNFELTDIEVHFAMTGQMNYKIKDLPDGTNVNFSVTD